MSTLKGRPQTPEHIARRLASRAAANHPKVAKPQLSPRAEARLLAKEKAPEIVERYVAGETASSLSRAFGLAVQTVIDIVRRAGYATRRDFGSGRDKRGPASHAWKGGRIKMSGGYIAVLLDMHDPLRVMGHTRADYTTYALEHRIVMARHLGRPLTRSETVHHINGDRADNRIENLQLRQGRHGKGSAFQCGDCGSRNIISTTLVESL